MRPLRISHFTFCSGMGRGVEAHRAGLLAEQSGLRPVDFPDVNFPTWIGRVDGVEQVRLADKLARYDCRNNRLAQLALETDGFSAAIRTAVSRYGATRIGLFLGTSTSGVQQAELAYLRRDRATETLPAEFHYNTTQSIYSLGDFVRQYLDLQGPSEVISTACSSSAKAFAVAQRFIDAGFCDAAVVGGIDSLCLMTLYGFNSLQLVSSAPCRPADESRKGLNIGEAAGFALLEPLSSADGEAVCLLGHGESSDAYHMSTPCPDGAGAALAMRTALRRAALSVMDIDYINLHGTATPANDLAEDAAVYSVFSGRVPCSSTKGFTGHTLGAAGGIRILSAIVQTISRALDQGHDAVTAVA